MAALAEGVVVAPERVGERVEEGLALPGALAEGARVEEGQREGAVEGVRVVLWVQDWEPEPDREGVREVVAVAHRVGEGEGDSVRVAVAQVEGDREGEMVEVPEAEVLRVRDRVLVTQPVAERLPVREAVGLTLRVPLWLGLRVPVAHSVGERVGLPEPVAVGQAETEVVRLGEGLRVRLCVTEGEPLCVTLGLWLTLGVYVSDSVSGGA